jgi:hypothetical protein
MPLLKAKTDRTIAGIVVEVRNPPKPNANNRKRSRMAEDKMKYSSNEAYYQRVICDNMMS